MAEGVEGLLRDKTHEPRKAPLPRATSRHQPVRHRTDRAPQAFIWTADPATIERNIDAEATGDRQS